MIGVLLVTHGKLGQELLNTCEMICGEQQNAAAIGLLYGDDIDDLSKQAFDMIERLDDGDGVIVFTDLFGGSPNNQTAANLKNRSFQQITGANIPMLLECFSMRESMSVEELASHVKECGIEGIRRMNDLIKVKE